MQLYIVSERNSPIAIRHFKTKRSLKEHITTNHCRMQWMVYQGFYSAIAIITPNTEYEDQVEGSSVNNTGFGLRSSIKTERNVTLNSENYLKSGKRDCAEYL